MIERVAVLGPGAVGAMLGAALTRTGVDTTLVGRPPTVAAIDRAGVHVRSALLGELDARPRAVERLEEPVDVLFVATKATGLESSLDRIAAPAAITVPLLNGVDHVAFLRERLGPGVAAATVRVSVHRDGGDPTRLTHVSPFWRFELAHNDPDRRARLEPVAALLRRAGAEATVRDEEAQTMWAKLARLCALASTTAAADLSIGGVRADPAWQAALEACVHEAVAVANAAGAHLVPAVVLGEFDELPPGQRTSMQEDLALGREPELDAIQGAVTRAGARHRIATPTIDTLAETIAVRAAAGRVPGV